ncbi:TetR/AcrR family transcriptional regulator [Leucobacter sp. NPDC058333]|uniref:TetR/AcrR family transcriptional regulator n=1 Tax=Leucobacter sp. NPDC058333 TaxID=3346450 RepID=UPI003668F236
MARPKTRSKVYAAVVALAQDQPVGAISMERIADRAGMSKQTLYSNWPSTGAILFEALLDRSTDASGTVVIPDTGDLAVDIAALAHGTVAELTDPLQGALLRLVAVEIQSDEKLAEQFREMLLAPQLRAISDRFRAAGVTDAEDIAELFVGPIFHRWLLRSRPFESEWIEAHVARTLLASRVSCDS